MEEDRLLAYPCDRYLNEPDDVIYRAIDIQASKEKVFRWLCQFRVAPYSYDWIDNMGKLSPCELIQGIDKLETGQRFLEIFKIVEFKTNEHITLKISHTGAENLFGVIAGSYIVNSLSTMASRLVVKLLVKRTKILHFKWMGPLLPWGDLVMMRKQLLNIKKLCEH